MRKIKKEEIEDKILEEIWCNKCGKQLLVQNEVLKEGCFHSDFEFGYFSEKDGEQHSFDLCEACYDALVKEFSIPVTIREMNELL
ncbi:MAG: hypothetical protein ACRC7V_06660 [Lachnospiraceae bacterium]